MLAKDAPTGPQRPSIEGLQMKEPRITADNPELFQAKGEARRLREALADMHRDISHSDALKVIARIKGHRNWEEFEGVLAAKQHAACVAPSSLSAATEEASAAKSDEKTQICLWLAKVEAAVRSRGFSCSDLDDLAYDSHGSEEASAINNAGMAAQLDARLQWHLNAPSVNLAMAMRKTLEDLSTLLDMSIVLTT